jgi:hypothetical protein
VEKKIAMTETGRWAARRVMLRGAIPANTDILCCGRYTFLKVMSPASTVSFCLDVGVTFENDTHEDEENREYGSILSLYYIVADRTVGTSKLNAVAGVHKLEV